MKTLLSVKKRSRTSFVLVLFLASLSPVVSMAQSSDWETAINRVEKSAKEYSDYAFSILDSRWVGPANDSIKFNVHRCAILGRMLDYSAAIQHIETFDYPPIDDTSEAWDLLVFSLTLENWVAAARYVLEISRDERINIWNLDCVGRMGISTNLFMESGQPNADFSFDGRTLFVYGDIEVGFFERLKIQLETNPSIREISLGSGGGSVKDALLAGNEIRRLGLSTTIYGNCFSACPLIFMGGTRRVLWASPYRLGFHQIYIGDGKALAADNSIYGIIARYMVAMGVNSEVVIPWMLSTPPNEIFEPNSSELCAPGVATFVQRVCGW